MVRISDNDNWFEMWSDDKEAMVETMIRNMIADLDAGYNPCGNIIKRERAEIDAYCKEYENQMDAFKRMDEAEVNRWCFYDMKKRGVIE